MSFSARSWRWFKVMNPRNTEVFWGKPRQKPWENHEKSWTNPGILRWYSAGIGQIKAGPRSPMNLGATITLVC